MKTRQDKADVIRMSDHEGRTPLRGYLWYLLLGLGLVTTSLVWTNQTSQANPVTQRVTTRAHATAVWKDTYGMVLCVDKFGAQDQGKVDLNTTPCAHKLVGISTTGGSPSDSGSIKVTIGLTGRSFPSGFHLWNIKEWTYWYWSDKGTHALGVPGYGTTKADHAHFRATNRSQDVLSSGVVFKGWKKGDTGYYNWEPAFPHTGFHHYQGAEFQVPNIVSPPSAEAYPLLKLNSHTDGTWWWDTSCQGSCT